MSKRTEVVGCLLSVIVVGACAPHQPAMAGEPGRGAARSEEVAGEASFPLAIWRGIEFPNRDNLSGALLPTSEGTIQIKELRWGVDRGGFLIVCSLTGYTQDGKAVSFSAPDDAEACTPAASKSDIQNAPVSATGGVLESFNFGTDQEGNLAFIDIVYRPEQLLQACGFVEVIHCRSEGCSGNCGVSIKQLMVGNLITTGAQVAPATIGTGTGGMMAPVNCRCTGATGSCVAVSQRECSGHCPGEGESCTMYSDPTGSTCQCSQ